MFDRRTLLTGSLGFTIASYLARAERVEAALLPRRAKHLIILWMNGGPSQLETFDPKIGVETAGRFAPIESAVSGIRISELLPQVAKQMKHLAVVRTMTSAEGNHVRASQLALTGHPPNGFEQPTVGSVVSSVLENEGPLPSFVSIGRPHSAGFLGAEHSSFNVRYPGRGQAFMNAFLPDRLERRLALADAVDHSFERRQPALAREHRYMRKSALDLMRSEERAAFELAPVSDEKRAAYGDTHFGRAAMVTEQLLDAGVRVVQIDMNGWDTHIDNFDRVAKLCADLDRVMSTLIRDLAASGRLDETLVAWMGEFGRTPRINDKQGRDHFPRAYSAVLAGGGIRGGQVVGTTSDTGMEITSRPVKVPELLATIYQCLGISPDHRLGSPKGRPIDAIPDGAMPIKELI